MKHRPGSTEKRHLATNCLFVSHKRLRPKTVSSHFQPVGQSVFPLYAYYVLS